MIVDASAVIAILRQGPEAQAFTRAIASATVRRISAVNYVEAAAVIDVGLQLFPKTRPPVTPAINR